MAETKIEWADAVWNPTRGCTKIGPGCKSCYAETFAERFRGVTGHPYELGFDPRTVPEKLAEPLAWRKPRRIFVDSMSDLFHEDFPFEYIAACFGVMAACPKHTFLVLTKRPARALEFFRYIAERGKAYSRRGEVEECFRRARQECDGAAIEASAAYEPAEIDWPLPNVWMGASVSTQADLDKNAPILLQIPAAVRFLSVEPMLGPVNIEPFLQYPPFHEDYKCTLGVTEFRGIEWVIVGGESGPGARPCDVAWIRSIVQQCREAGTACFVKQLGANVRDRNDAGFDGDGDWPEHIGAECRAELDPDDDAQTYQGAAVRIHLRDRKGGDPDEWPEDLRVREFPEVAR